MTTATHDAAHERTTVLLVLVLATLAWLPIPLGSNRTWSLALMCALATTLLGFWSLGIALGSHAWPGMLARLRVPLALLGAWLALALVQLVPLPVELVSAVGGRAHQSYLMPPGYAPLEHAYLSLDRDATVGGLLLRCGVLAIFLLVLALAATSSRLELLLKALFAIGFAQAIYGLAVLLGAGQGAAGEPTAAGMRITGTYVNQNHFAGLMELTIPIGLALYLARPRQAMVFSSARTLARSLITFALDGRGIIVFCLVVMCGALMLTASRGALLSLVAAIALTSLAVTISSGRRARELGAGVVLALALAGAAAWFGVEGLSSKLGAAGLESNRGDLRELSYRMIADHPWFGTGLGTFEWVSPVYKDVRFGAAVYDHAHNDFLEMAVEQGVPGALLFAVALALMLARLLAGLRRVRQRIARAAIFAGLCGSSSLLIHGLVDFNLHIPANVGLFFALLAIACGATAERFEKRESAPAAGDARILHPMRAMAAPSP